MIRRVSLVALLHLLFAGGTFAIPALAEEFSGPKVEDSEEYYELYRLLVDSVDQIERNYVEEVDRRELVEAAIEGMINRLDPYSDYISPEELDKFQSSVLSQFGGIGIQVSDKGEWIKVISPIVGSPAYRAGVLAGDEILAIDGESAEGIDIDEAVRRMKGKIGTEVDVTVRHERGGNETFALKRELVKVRTVLGERRRADEARVVTQLGGDEAQGGGGVQDPGVG